MKASHCIRRAALVLLCALGCEQATAPRQRAPGEGVLPSAGEPPRDSDTIETSSRKPDSGAGGASEPDEAGGGTGGLTIGTELTIEVAENEPTYVSLATASLVDVDDAQASRGWDLQFQGWDIFTNGGASGDGESAAFGPLPFSHFSAETEPEVPFLIEDKAAGAFLDWYFYDGQWHSLYSRFHIYGVRTGDRLFKVQVLGYYGDVQGAPIAALYRLRYAEVTSESNGDVVEVPKVDATAGGLGGDRDAASGCLSLLSGEQAQLSPSQAAASSLWDLRFRRDSISINGGSGGPGRVAAVDLDAALTETETLAELELLTAENQAARFAAVDYATLSEPSLEYRQDRKVSAFTGAWAELADDPPTLATDNVWLVVSADGKGRYLLGLTAIEQATTLAPGRVVMRILQVR